MNALISNYFEKTRMTKIEQKITFCHYRRSSGNLKGVEYVRRTLPSDITGLQEEYKVTHVEKSVSQTGINPSSSFEPTDHFEDGSLKYQRIDLSQCR